MRLTIVYFGSVSFNGAYYLCDKAFGVYVDSLAAYFEKVEIVSPVSEKVDETHSYELKSQNTFILPLPTSHFKESPSGTILKYIFYTNFLAKNIKKWELIYIFIPSYIGVLAFVLSKIFSKQLFIYVGSEWGEVSKYVFKWDSWWKRILLQIYKFFNAQLEKLVIPSLP